MGIEKQLGDTGCERAVLAGICQHGGDIYFDVADILQPSTFTTVTNQILYDCFKHVLEQDPNVILDVPTIQSAAREIGMSTMLEGKENAQYIQALFDFPVHKKNARKFAAKIRKLQITRLLHAQLGETQNSLLELSGNESIAHILGIAENAIFDFSSLLNDNEDEPVLIGKGLTAYVKYLAENPVQQLGVATGFPQYDLAIGGGLRNGTVNVIGARPKIGKTLLSDNMGYYMADTGGLPVLNMDTEMQLEDHQHRTLAMATECYIHDVETGKYAQKPGTREKVEKAAKYIEGIGRDTPVPYYHKSVANKSFEEQLALMRRWIVKEVGLNADGTAKPCVIIYDYLKLQDSTGLSNDLKEYQMLGFMMTALHNFTVRYKIPMLMFIQLNRDGITKETTDIASGSDRIVWLCTNLTIFKAKSAEELADDKDDTGNRKLVPLASRHGAEFLENDYINCYMKGYCAKITEGQRQSTIQAAQTQNNSGFVVQDDVGNNGEDISFK